MQRDDVAQPTRPRTAAIEPINEKPLAIRHGRPAVSFSET